MKNRQMRSSRGFTLTELLVVIGILGVIAMVGHSFLQPSLDHVNVSAVTEEIAGALRYARESSIGNTYQCKVSIDFKADTLAVERREYNAMVFDTTRTMLTEVHIAQNAYSVVDHPTKKGYSYQIDFAEDPRFGGVDIVSAQFGGEKPIPASIIFDDCGRANTSGTITVGRGVDTAYVMVDTFSGTVTVSGYADE